MSIYSDKIYNNTFLFCNCYVLIYLVFILQVCINIHMDCA